MSDAKIKIAGVTVAVLLHLIVAGVLTQDAIMRVLFPKKAHKEMVEQTAETEPVMSFRFVARPEPLPTPPAPKPEEQTPPPPKVADKQRYNRTTDEQPQEKPKDAKFYGDADTVAQSTADAVAGAPEMPSVRGKDKQRTSLASSYQDGSLENENLGKPSKPTEPVPTEIPSPSEVESVAENSSNDDSQNQKVEQMDAGKPLAGSRVPLADYLEAVNKLPSELKSADPITDLPESNKGKADSESQKEQRPKEVAKGKDKPKPKQRTKPIMPIERSSQPGFRPEVEASKMVGSISRRGGVSSLDTEATPLGKYKKSVHNSIAKEWYRRVGQNPDLIKPGLLQVRWYVYDNGKVRDINILQELQGSEIQKGITIQAISRAKIPKMPAALKQELAGDPVEITISFQF
ncbi:hypothetical protein [Rubritalea tangerina]|uniref:TonB C-terminal domain-containing protein n=1 Tax=Rubritalea tangerina TaxID=430798 RepID=A0ABW4Z6L6_9BACT